MALFRQRLGVAQKAAAIVIFVTLAANQWGYLFRVHSRHSFLEPQDDPPHNQHSKRFNSTTDSNDQQEHLRSPEITIVNEIIHRAFFGLGHRLHRLAAVYHLAQSLSSPQTQISSTAVHGQATPNQFQDQPIITHLRFHWESCLPADEIRNATEGIEDYNVFRYLFGDDLWALNQKDGTLRTSQKYPMATKDSENSGTTSNDMKPQIRRNMIVLRNDIPGYVAGQIYKDFQLPVNRSSSGTFSQYDGILDKIMRSDVEFYRRLIDNYKFQNELEDFQIQHKWNERPFVIGLHLRAGNGEGAHFKESGRASSLDTDESTMIARLVQLINMMVIRETKRLGDREVDALEPLLFIATDSAHLLPLIDKAIKDERNFNDPSRPGSEKTFVTRPRAVNLEIVSWPQEHLPRNAGVSFEALKGKGERCLLGWKSSVSDVLLLSKADVLIAATRSTFTQSLPLTLGFDRNRQENYDVGVKDTIASAVKDDNDLKKISRQSKESGTRNNRRFSFCEVSEPDVTKMACYTDARTWLFRGEDDQNDPSDKHGSVNYPQRNERTWSFSIPNTASGALDQKDAYHLVEHKVTVLVPDFELPHEFNQARQYLRRQNALGSKPTASGTEIHESIFRYGQMKFDDKYRGVVTRRSSRWNFIHVTK